MERRHFIKTALLGAVAGATTLKSSSLFAGEKAGTPAEDAKAPADLVAAMGWEPEELYAKAIAEMGGMSRFVKKGQKVVIKPNIGWDKAPEFGANTNPLLVAAIVKDCFKAGAKEVVVFDHSCDDCDVSYKHSGIEDAAKEAGAIVAFAHDKRYYKEVEIPQGERMKKADIHEALINCDVWINVPVLKNHGSAKMTCAMKNYMGIVWDRGYLHTHNLQQCIADIATYEKRPVLNIVDAYRIMTQNGPKGKTLDDVQTPKAIFMSPDIVAVDTAACKFLSQFSKMVNMDVVGHIGLGEKHNLGTTDLDSLNVVKINK